MKSSTRAQRIKSAREIAGFRQADVANHLKKSVSTIKSWEKDGGSEPNRLDDVSKLCSLYGISTDYFINGREHRGRYSKVQAQTAETMGQLPEKIQHALLSMIQEILALQNKN